VYRRHSPDRPQPRSSSSRSSGSRARRDGSQKELFDWTVDFNNKGRQAWTDKGGELIKLSTVGDEVVASQPRVKEVYDLMVHTAKAKR
jgi:hypothetical protein